MFLSSILCCCDLEIEDSDRSPHKVPLKLNDHLSSSHHSHKSCSVYQEPLFQEMCDLQVPRANDILIRQDYYTLSSDKVYRLSCAISRMTVSEQNDPSYFSPYFQTASHKKWVCSHSNYIPKHMMYLWYRAYLHDFEVALQKADIACGNDGKITIPYIDIKEHPFVPAAFKDFKFPGGYIQGNDELCKTNTVLGNDNKISKMLADIDISKYICNDRINDLVDVIMDAYGFDENEYSSFHPFYYMILSYIDKLHETYNKYNKQNITPKSVEYWKILVPFRKLPIELIDTGNLGYKYL